MSKKDPLGYYAILGVDPIASADDVKAAFRRRAMELHPDRNKAKNATAQFQFLNTAYGVLSDPTKRAGYDTSAMEVQREERRPAEEEPPDPIVCSACGAVTAQPRYAVYYQTVSYIVMTNRTVASGIFCSKCAEKKALKASAVTWIAGWWGIPWGPIYSVHSLFVNLFGGERPALVNARLAAHQAWVFAVRGQLDMARSVAHDALRLARNGMPWRLAWGADAAKKREEVAELRAKIERFLSAREMAGSHRELVDAWAVLRRPFYVQVVMTVAVIGAVVFAILQPSRPPEGKWSATRIDRPDTPPVAAARYVRPAKAPNGIAWPNEAGYMYGYPYLNFLGLSTLTIDNAQNDSDVFVKVMDLDAVAPTPVRAFFIPAHGRFTAQSLDAGRYDVRYRDLNTGDLARSEPFTLDETETGTGTRYSRVEMTLYKVRSGNMRTYAIGESEF